MPGTSVHTRFRDRSHAGRELARVLAKYQNQPGVVYALPRGGVVLGVEVAEALSMPLDLVIPRKIGHPFGPEYGIGAVTESGEAILDPVETGHIDRDWLAAETDRQRAEARRRRALYVDARPAAPVAGRTAVLVDDGIATGLTMQAAIRDVRRREPARIIVAVPVIPRDAVTRLAREADELACISIPVLYLGSVGAYYQDFPQLTDEEVVALLARVRGD